MKKLTAAIILSALLLFSLSGCGSGNSENSSGTDSSNAATNAVAGGEDKAPEVEINTENLDPIYGTDLKDGTYEISVDSSSSMFKISKCELTVSNGKMTAVMTMNGKGYLYLFMGKGENASESEYISFEENENGEHAFTVPVEALDMAVECSAFSKKKEQWYDRILVFRADSLPIDAYLESSIATSESLGLIDGEYTVDAVLSGGSGKAYVESPAKLTVENGKVFAEIVWSSSNYDYMIVDDEKYELLSSEGNSSFRIPVLYFDKNMPVSANTTAMSTPHEIEYTLYFDSASIKSKS